MSATPLVTVLMPAYNSARYLAESLESILQQTWTDFECVIIDGGSTDATHDIIKAYAARDPRVRLEVFPGLHPSKRGDAVLPHIKSRYIAIQHSDDVSYHHRFARQLMAFEADPQLGVCSALTRSFWHNRAGQPPWDGVFTYPRPEHHFMIKAQLLFWWVMHYPSMMYDREKLAAIDFKFTNAYPYGNDYWHSITNIDKLKYYNIQEELSAYRMHQESDGYSNMEELRHEEAALKKAVLRHFGFEATPREEDIHAALKLLPDRTIGATTPAEHDEVVAWLEKLRAQNEARGIFDRPYFAALVEALTKGVLAMKARLEVTPGAEQRRTGTG